MKQKYIVLALLSLIGTSCSNQDLEEKYTDAGQVQVTADIAKSRVSFNEADDMTYAYWQTGDAITLSTPTQGNLNYTATVSEDDSTVATFAPEDGSLKDIDGETVYACYPAASITDGVVTLPATNTWTDAQPLPFAYAVSSITDSKVDLAFEHTFAFLKLTLDSRPLANATSTDGDKTVHSLLIKSATESLGVVSGTFNFEDKSVNITEGSTEVKFTLGTAFNPSEETERSIYIPILPQSGDVAMTISLMHTYDSGEDVLLTMDKQAPTDGFVAGNIYTLSLTGNSSAVIEGESAEIYLAEAGTLSNYITDENKFTIKSLKLSGFLNGADFKLLREMAGCGYDNFINSFETTSGQLASLDMSDAYIVEDNQNAYIHFIVGYESTKYYTQDNVWGDYLFFGCASLVSVILPNKITEIGTRAFYRCTYLTDVKIPAKTLKISDEAFSYCKSLVCIKLPNELIEIGEYAFSNCASLTDINIPNGVTSIYNVFRCCSSLTSIEIPDGITDIRGTFAYCTSLTNVKIPDGITDISDTFTYCTSLSDIKIPDGITNISGAFQGCSSLISIKIPDGVTNISGAFQGCSSLTSIEIPDRITDLGSSTFSGCTSLTNIEIPNGVNKIGVSVFEKCTSLTDIYIPDGVNEISLNTFYGCSSLKSVRIPNGIVRINNYAFYMCTSLKDFYCYSTVPPQLGDWYVFTDVSADNLYVPKGCAEAYKKNSGYTYHFKNIIEMEE